MSVNIKTLQQKQFKVPVEPSDTIAHVKAKIESINGDPVANQKLLFSGKTLADDIPVEQCNLKETDFLVLMISKMRPTSEASILSAPPGSFAFTPATSASTFSPTSGISPSGLATTPGFSTSGLATTPGFSTSGVTTTPGFSTSGVTTTPGFSTSGLTSTPSLTIPPSSDRAPSDSAPAPSEPATEPPTESTATPTTTTSAPEERSGPSLVGMQTAFATGPPSENAIQRLRDMGFPENMIRPALRVAYNNPDRAAEFLMSGDIPRNTDVDNEQPSAATEAPSQESATPSLSTELPSADARDPMHIVTPGVAAENRGPRPAGSGLGGLSGLSGLGGMGGTGGLGGMGGTGGLGGMGATSGRGMGGMGGMGGMSGLSGMGGMGGLSGMGGMGGMSGLGGMSGMGGMGGMGGLGGMGGMGGGMGGMGGLSGMGGMGGLSGLGGMGGMGGLGGMGSRSSRPNPTSTSNSDSSSQFSQFRQMVQQYPALLQPLIDQLRTSNPRLAEAFQRDPELALRMFEAFGGNDEDGGSSGSGMGRGVQTVAVTGEEKEAIERIEAMGFPRNKSIEAYFACDRNEELAVNYLLEHGDDN